MVGTSRPVRFQADLCLITVTIKKPFAAFFPMLVRGDTRLLSLLQ